MKMICWICHRVMNAKPKNFPIAIKQKVTGKVLGYICRFCKKKRQDVIGNWELRKEAMV